MFVLFDTVFFDIPFVLAAGFAFRVCAPDSPISRLVSGVIIQVMRNALDARGPRYETRSMII
jgi:hypothetical protein